MSDNNAQASSTPTTSNPSSSAKKSLDDFEILKVIGEGSFSTVHLVKDKKNGVLFAMKECDKRQILKENKTKYVFLEKRILHEFLKENPYFVQLYCTFQDDSSLYFVLTYCSNGDLLNFIKKFAQYDLEKTRFYTAELVDALEYMHGKNVIHRDLKPENILLDDKFHIKITDFGTARIMGEAVEKTEPQEGQRPTRRRNSFVGTAQFVAPEILQGKEPSFGTDLWSLGCIIFQMLTSKHLFTGGHEYDIFQKIIRCSLSFPDDFPEKPKDLIQKLVVLDPMMRLGLSGQSQSYNAIRQHEFFESLDWNKLYEQTPPGSN